ncbi:MAG: DISARM system SNF2-like helicase DrmD [Sandaracinaceae bacterium]
MVMTATSRSVLSTLPKSRLLELGRDYGVALDPGLAREVLAEALAGSGKVLFRDLLGRLGRDELRAACRAHQLDASGRARPELQARLLQAHGGAASVLPPPLFRAHEVPRYAPRAGDIVSCRHRQWLVEEVIAPPAERHATRVRLVCLDDDNSGDALEVLWELELGARVIQPEVHGLGEVDRIDPPRRFAAYLHALKWSQVTATEARLFQSPFRAGIKLLDHQLTPLKKALSLPRANLFIADDVGLGKTIEAGLVMQELLLRQRVELILVCCPSSVALQWQAEMLRRFGLHFEVMSRAFIARRRQERGFGINPWSTHQRFIVTHSLLRRPEYRDTLLSHLSTLTASGEGEGRARKSLFVLDEAHVAAPASATKYAIDSDITKVIRDVAPRFENRLFLSATPHNGHSNSFSALLEILDPQRFTRGVKVRGASQLEAVMVRRLKEDLRALGVDSFPVRQLVQVDLEHVGPSNGSGQWRVRRTTFDPRRPEPMRGESALVGAGEPVELTLSSMLAEYTTLMRPEKGRGRLVFVNLQKRLLSSVEAFARTLRVHARAVAEGRARTQLDLNAAARTASTFDDEPEGLDDDALDEAEAADVASASTGLQSPAGRARQLLDEMVALAEGHRAAPDAKVLALLAFIREHQCAAVGVGGAVRGADRGWSDRRILVFTEYGDTKRYLWQLLSAAVDGTEGGQMRLMQLHGGMSEEAREEVQRAFNAPPDEHPVRILIATDAAREGVNLQGHCADLFHFDVPWNPARMEQRNGRIDRTLQPAPEVRCHYFVYPQRAEDVVLTHLVRKVDVIQRELGSLGAVVMDRIEAALESGIDARTRERLDRADGTVASGTTEGGPRGLDIKRLRDTTRAELESPRHDQTKLRTEIEEAGELLNRSRAVMDFDATLLRDAIDVGLELAGASPLTPAEGGRGWSLPELPDSWQSTLDLLRPPRARDEPFYEWRKRPPQPVVFEPPAKMNDALVHLHLAHPFVQRILGRFLAQGYGAHDLTRVTIVRTRHDSLARVIAFGRLSLFGAGAARLHDRLLSVGARWIEGKEDELRPFGEEADRKAVGMLEQLLAESPTLDGVSESLRDKVRAAAPRLFAKLWETLRADADADALEATQKLRERGRQEADALRAILEKQRNAIVQAIEERHQLSFDFTPEEEAQKRQFEDDEKHMHERLVTLQLELEREPAQLEALYRVVLHRLEPVGLVVLWPETRG